MATDYHFDSKGQLVSEDDSSVFTLPKEQEDYSATHNGLEITGKGASGPCLVYVEVNRVWYFDPKQSRRDSPRRFTESMILEASRKAHPETPLLGGLEEIVEQRRSETREKWVKMSKKA